MNRERPDWELLNAYVDGELDAAERVRVANAVADDRDTAHAVAVLSRLKQATQDAGRAEMAETPAFDPPPPRRPRRRRSLWIAATAAVLLVAAAVGLTIAPWPNQESPAWIDTARAVHTEWADMPDSRDNGDPAGTGAVLAAVEDFGRVPFVPDFSANKLTLTTIRTTRIRARPAIQLGYRGTRGCRVSLLVLAGSGEMPAELQRLESEAGPIFVWRGADLGYALLASGMDPKRLQLLAEAAHKATRTHSQPGERTRTALARSRAESEPCPAA